MKDMKYLEEKRLNVLQELRPICEAFGIKDYDYEVYESGQTEILRVEDVKIACSCNSMFAIKQELVGLIFLSFWRERSLGHFDKQSRNVIKKYWMRWKNEH